MNFSGTALLLWGVGSALNCALLATWWIRNERNLRSFGLWLGANFVGALALFALYCCGFPSLYFCLYWLLALIDILLQVSVIAELAKEALQRDGCWVPGAASSLAWGVAQSVGLSVASLFLRPASDSSADLVYARVSLFSTVLVCSLFTSLIRAASQLGYSWSGLSVSVSYGLVAWNIASFGTDALHLYWRRATVFTGVEYARAASFQGILVYWIAILLTNKAVVGQQPLDMQRIHDSYMHYRTAIKGIIRVPTR